MIRDRTGPRTVLGLARPARAARRLDASGPSAAAPDEGPGGPILVIAERRGPVQPLLRRDPARRGPQRVRRHRHLERHARRCSPAHDVVDPRPDGALSAGPGDDADRLGAGRRQPDRDAPGPAARRPARPQPARRNTLANGYLKVDTATAPRRRASSARRSSSTAPPTATRPTRRPDDRHASSRTPTTATANPAVTLRSVGANGGQAAAFTYDLARSVVYTRQGNPAWAGQERDGRGGRRSAPTTSSSGPRPATSSPTGSTSTRSRSRRPTSSSACSPT